MARGDLQLPTFNCLVCKRKRQGPGPICIHCQRLADRQEALFDRSIKGLRVKKVLHHTLTPKIKAPRNAVPFPEDSAILASRFPQVNPLYYYTLAWEAQDGKCSHCHKPHLKMRATYANSGRIHKLRCPSCHSTLQNPGPSSKKSQTGTNSWTDRVWTKSDNLMRAMLSSNPQFIQECLTQEQTPATLELELEQVPALE